MGQQWLPTQDRPVPSTVADFFSCISVVFSLLADAAGFLAVHWEGGLGTDELSEGQGGCYLCLVRYGWLVYLVVGRVAKSPS